MWWYVTYINFVDYLISDALSIVVKTKQPKGCTCMGLLSLRIARSENRRNAAWSSEDRIWCKFRLEKNFAHEMSIESNRCQCQSLRSKILRCALRWVVGMKKTRKWSQNLFQWTSWVWWWPLDSWQEALHRLSCIEHDQGGCQKGAYVWEGSYNTWHMTWLCWFVCCTVSYWHGPMWSMLDSRAMLSLVPC